MKALKNLGRTFIVLPVVKILILFKIPPNAVTLSSLVLAAVSALLYWYGLFWAGALFLLLCGLFDTFDGEIARQTNRVSRIGGFLDSTVDRINEFIVYFGLFGYYYSHQRHALVWLFCALFGSMMVSYTRARGEALGISPQVGIFERLTRFTLLVIGSMFGPHIVVYVLVILTVGTIQTMIQRIVFTHIKSSHH
jgi:CDP-diacylglycerol--glycerol-3-phosphate 3-phosphatidyltransferase